MEATEGTKTIIAQDVEISGSIKSASDIHIEGKLEGDMTCAGKATIGKNAIIKGNLNVESVTILGQINGNTTARDRIEMKATARVAGDIKSKRLTVEDGVTFVGKSEVNPSGAPVAAASPAQSQAKPPQAASQQK